MNRAALLLGLFLFGLTGISAAAAPPDRFIPLLDAGDAIPPIPLRAQNGRPFTLADLHGNAILVSFIYTRCADARMCPLVTAKFGRLAHLVGDAPIRLVLLTLDPGYDTPAVLRRYGRAFGQDERVWTLGTGSAATMNELAQRLGIAVTTAPAGGLSHTEAAIVVGPDGRIARTIAGNGWSATDLLDAARATLPGGSDRFGPLRGWLSSALERCGSAGGALGGGGMLAILAVALLGIGLVFWRAFRTPPTPPRTRHHPSTTSGGSL